MPRKSSLPVRDIVVEVRGEFVFLEKGNIYWSGGVNYALLKEVQELCEGVALELCVRRLRAQRLELKAVGEAWQRSLDGG